LKEQRDTIGGEDDSATAATLDPTASDSLPGDESRVVVRTTRVGRFLLLREIGAGGMGSVFAAYDEQLDRRVALKLLRKPRAGSRRQRMMVLREARAAARISHPNVIAIYDVGEIDGQIHIAMEYVDGETLLKWQKESQRSWRDILHMYLEVGQALQAAHQSEVIHRDFKPDKITPVGKWL
jgi:serine/threonine protein kinase